MNDVIQMNDQDNLATALRDIRKGEVIKIKEKNITVNCDIPKFHKLAIADIPRGAPAYKYGESIGFVTEDVHTGDYVHVHNLESARGRGDKQ